jgi:ribulose-5-phosphate 4-epimerase/fuculose-1-phosphate aldolase
MYDEGYIKFDCTWMEEELPDKSMIDELYVWRQKLFNQRLIGAYANGIGYGNISCRLADNTFLITGTATGKLKQLTAKHFTRVTAYDIPQNSLTCKGPIRASSESLTHAIIYETISWVNAVVHVHNHVLWKNLLDRVPTTSIQVAYGTPEMAIEIKRLIVSTNLKNERILVMAGHEDGLLTFGKDLVDASSKILDIYKSNF